MMNTIPLNQSPVEVVDNHRKARKDALPDVWFDNLIHKDRIDVLRQGAEDDKSAGFKEPDPTA